MQQAIQKVYRHKAISHREAALIHFKYETKQLGVACKGVQHLAHGLHAA